MSLGPKGREEVATTVRSWIENQSRLIERRRRGTTRSTSNGMCRPFETPAKSQLRRQKNHSYFLGKASAVVRSCALVLCNVASVTRNCAGVTRNLPSVAPNSVAVASNVASVTRNSVSVVPNCDWGNAQLCLSCAQLCRGNAQLDLGCPQLCLRYTQPAGKMRPSRAKAALPNALFRGFSLGK
jgi:hypothetical protein